RRARRRSRRSRGRAGRTLSSEPASRGFVAAWSMPLAQHDRRTVCHPAGALPHRPDNKSVLNRSYLAEWTGLEPATPGVTGRYSNQLNYHSSCPSWWVLTGSNRRHSPCKGDALPTELSTHVEIRLRAPMALSCPRSPLAVLLCTIS